MLSEEEKQAIEYLNEFKSIKVMYGNTFVMFLEQLKKYQQATNAALNLITKQQKENEELKNKNQDLLRKLRNRVKEVKKLTKYSLYKKEFSKLNKIIKEKDKQIDLMAEFINKQDIDEDICKNNMSDLCDEFGLGINCIKCIKQYFESKSKEE